MSPSGCQANWKLKTGICTLLDWLGCPSPPLAPMTATAFMLTAEVERWRPAVTRGFWKRENMMPVVVWRWRSCRIRRSCLSGHNWSCRVLTVCCNMAAGVTLGTADHVLRLRKVELHCNSHWNLVCELPVRAGLQTDVFLWHKISLHSSGLLA